MGYFVQHIVKLLNSFEKELKVLLKFCERYLKEMKSFSKIFITFSNLL